MFHHFFKVFNAVVHLEMNPIAMKGNMQNCKDTAEGWSLF